jgi:hypothetical protein
MKTHKLAGDGHDTRSIQNYLGHRTTVRLHRAVANAFQRFLARPAISEQSNYWASMAISTSMTKDIQFCGSIDTRRLYDRD